MNDIFKKIDGYIWLFKMKEVNNEFADKICFTESEESKKFWPYNLSYGKYGSINYRNLSRTNFNIFSFKKYNQWMMIMDKLYHALESSEDCSPEFVKLIQEFTNYKYDTNYIINYPQNLYNKLDHDFFHYTKVAEFPYRILASNRLDELSDK